MNKLAGLVLFVSLSSMLLYGAPQMADDKASATQNITGCVEKGTESGGFFLLTSDNKHWELYSNAGVSLAEHVGHTVTVTGTMAHRSKAQETKSQPSEQKEIGTRKHDDLQVSDVKMVSTTCSK